MEVKDRILVAAEELFLRFGYKSITMDEIAKHLAISKKTIYQYFKDKDEIVLLVAEEYFRKDKAKFEQILATAENPVDEIWRLSKSLKEAFSHINPSLLFETQKYYPKAWKLFQDHKQGFIKECITRNLMRGIEEGLYRPDINVEVMARLRLEQVQWGFDPMIFPTAQFNFLEVQIQLIEHLIRGIITPKGLQLLNNYQNKL